MTCVVMHVNNIDLIQLRSSMNTITHRNVTRQVTIITATPTVITTGMPTIMDEVVNVIDTVSVEEVGVVEDRTLETITHVTMMSMTIIVVNKTNISTNRTNSNKLTFITTITSVIVLRVTSKSLK